MDRVELNIQEGLALAGQLFAAARFEEAGRLFQQIAKAAPGNFDAVHGAGAALGAQKEYGAALPWHDQAIGIALNQLIAASLNKASALGELNCSEEALKLIDSVFMFRSQNAAAHYYRGILRMQLHKWDDAIEDFNASLALDQSINGGEAFYCRGYCELALGDYSNGFRDYEYRQRPPLAAPEEAREKWIGQDLNGKRIMVLHEQGAGDMILFARYFPLLVARGAEVFAFLPAELCPLFEGMPGVTARSKYRGETSDFWIHIASLPHVFGTTIDTVPPPFPVEFGESHLDKWRRIIPNDAGQFNVGLCWAGGANHKFNRARSMPLAALEPIVSLREIFPRLRFFGLVPEISERDQEMAATLPIEHIGPRFQDYRRTAHAIKCLDLVITVDTSVAHVAGIVGTRCIVMLSKARNYWVYPDGRHDTPWYPSLRTIKQQHVEGDWSGVVHNIREVLMAELIA